MYSFLLSWSRANNGLALAIVLVCLLLGATTSCVRYYPSRAEMNRPFGMDPATEFVGPEAFYLYDLEQRKRLEGLIQERVKNSSGTFDTAYRIGSGDRLTVEVKNFEEVSKEYTVNLEGKIKLPFVGTIDVKGLSEEEVAARISKIVQDYVLEPQVHVEVTDHSAHKVWVIGGGYAKQAVSAAEVSDSRAYPLRRPNYSLVELLVEVGLAAYLDAGGVIYLYPQGALHSGLGGPNQAAESTRRVTVEDHRHDCRATSQQWLAVEGRTDEGSCSLDPAQLAALPLDEKYDNRARIMIDIEELFGGNRKAPLHVPLRPGDAIYIPDALTIHVFGEVNRKGTYRLGGAKDIRSGGDSTKPSLMSILAEAQGLTYAADIHNIEIYRELEFGKKVVMGVDFERVTLRGTQDIRLRDGDVIWVPSQAGRFIEDHSINAVNQALGIGNRAYVTGTQ